MYPILKSIIFVSNFFFVIFFTQTAFASVLLHLDFNDSNHLGAQSGTMPPGEPHGDVKPSAIYPGSADFGKTGGSIRIPGFNSPKGAFTVEARFLIRNFGPESSNFIANILNTVVDFHQGFAFRVGGGYLYPPLPRNAYKTESEWLSAQGTFSNVARERLSDCFAVFVIAGAGGRWKEVYADRCIEKNTWTHFVGTWDGANMRIYLNGTDASDPWRIQGSSAAPLLGGMVDAYVGSRTLSDFDSRNIDGILDYVKVEDGALSENEIHRRYKDGFVPEVRDSFCMGIVTPQYPAAGQLCKGKLDLEFKIINHGACTDPAFLAAFLAGDSVEVEIAKNSTFTEIVLRTVVSGTTLNLEAQALPGLAGYHGTLYWRVRLVRVKQGGLAKSAATFPGEWSLSRPLVLDLSEVSAINIHRQSLKPVLIQDQMSLFVAGNENSSAPVLSDLAGKRQSPGFQRVPGGWRMNLTKSGLSGLYFIVK